MNTPPENPTSASAQAATETREASQRVRSDAGSEMWAFASEPGSENWKGPFASKHEAISEALAYYGDPEDRFRPCVSPCRPVRPDDDHVGENWGWVCEGEVEEIEIVDSQNNKVCGERSSPAPDHNAGRARSQ